MVDAWPSEVIDQAIDVLTPASRRRLSELLHAPAILQVPRHDFFPDGRGIEELFLILNPPGSALETVFALAVSSDDTLRLGRIGLPAGCLDAVRAQAQSPCEDEVDALLSVMQEHGRDLFASLSACAEVALWSCRNPRSQSAVMPTLDNVLGRTWLNAAEVWFGELGEDDLAALACHGLSVDVLLLALQDRMSGRCAGVLNHLDYFEAGVEHDPILSMWRQFLRSAPESDFVPSLVAFNYLVSRDVVVMASRVAIWDDPLFMTRVQNYAYYQRAAEALMLPS